MITLFLLIIWPRNGFSSLGHYIDIIKGLGRSFLTTSKEKDDEDCEYEMVWDAEGSMHLVKKASNRTQPTKSDLGSTGR